MVLSDLRDAWDSVCLACLCAASLFEAGVRLNLSESSRPRFCQTSPLIARKVWNRVFVAYSQCVEIDASRQGAIDPRTQNDATLTRPTGGRTFSTTLSPKSTQNRRILGGHSLAHYEHCLNFFCWLALAILKRASLSTLGECLTGREVLTMTGLTRTPPLLPWTARPYFPML